MHVGALYQSSDEEVGSLLRIEVKDLAREIHEPCQIISCCLIIALIHVEVRHRSLLGAVVVVLFQEFPAKRREIGDGIFG